jgi:putative DNA primase/helicase
MQAFLLLGMLIEFSTFFIKKLAKMFIMIGNGSNAKGTLLLVLQKILGPRNFSTVRFSDFTKNTDIYSMIGKLANIDDDIVDRPINQENMKIIKNITTADMTNVRHFHQHSFNARIKATLIGSSNHPVKTYEKSDSWKRRIVWLPLYEKIDDFKKRKGFFYNLTETPEAMAYWIRLMIEAYIKLYKDQDFVIPDIVKNYNEEYHMQNDNTLEYVENMTIDDFLNMPVKDAKALYKEWCDENDYTALNIRNLDETIEKKFGLVKKNTRKNGYAGLQYVEK